LQQPAALAGLGPVAFAAPLIRVLLYQGLNVLVALLIGHGWSFSQIAARASEMFASTRAIGTEVKPVEQLHHLRRMIA
jgi:hypothetical protein